MAEVIGLVASVASLIAFTSETSKACHKLAKRIAIFQNAQTDTQKIGVELLDLAQVLELIESVLQPLQDGKVGLQDHANLVERSLVRIKTGVQDIADALIAVQPTARGSSTKGRAKWMYKKNDITSMMTIIDKQKQGLLLQFNILNAKLAYNTHGDLKDFRKDLKQVGPQIEDLAASITSSISESVSRFENVVQTSATSLQSSIRDEVHQTVLSIPRESNVSQASLQILSVLVSNILVSRIQSLESETSLKNPGSRSCIQVESAQGSPTKPQTEDVGTMTSVSQTTIESVRNEKSSRFSREGGRTSVQTMTSVFGRVVIRRFTVKVVYLDSDPEVFSERTKMEIDFIPASWLRSWTSCGIFLARMGFGKPAFDFNFILARVLDFHSNLDTRKAFRAVETGDIRTLIGSLHRKIVYPTDRDLNGLSLLSIAAISEQLEICELLLQQGAAVDINTPNFIMDIYPIEHAISSSTMRKDHDFVSLFLRYGADVAIDNSRSRLQICFEMLPFLWECAKTQETRYLFGSLIENDHSFDIKRIYTAIWHQALKICGLSGSNYCHCPVHNQEMIIRSDDDSHSPSRRWGLDRLLPYEIFEEEMSAALKGWDKAGIRGSYPSGARFGRDGELPGWGEQVDAFDEWIQEVLIEAQARQNRTSSKCTTAAGQPVESRSEGRNRDNFERDEMQSSDQFSMNRSVPLTHQSHSDEDWETNSSVSSNGEEEWESAPEA